MKKLILLFLIIPSISFANPHELYEELVKETGKKIVSNSIYSFLYKSKMTCEISTKYKAKSFIVESCHSSEGLVCVVITKKSTKERSFYCSN